MTGKTASDARKPRRGRTPFPPAVSRHKRIVTFVTGDESAQLERLAEGQGKSISAVVYEILSGYLDRQRE